MPAAFASIVMALHVYRAQVLISAGHEGYADRQVDGSDGSLVIEPGELTCPVQRAWLATHLCLEGDLLAKFLFALIGQGDLRLPANSPV